MSFWGIFGGVSIHGLSQLDQKKKSQLKLFGWIVVIILAFSAIVYQLTGLGQVILTYPSNVQIEVLTTKSVFPAVTACNLGVYKNSVTKYVPTFINMATVYNDILQMIPYLAPENTSVRKRRSNQVLTKEKSPQNFSAHVREKRAVLPGQLDPDCSQCAYMDGLCATNSFNYAEYGGWPSVSYNQSVDYCTAVGGNIPVFKTEAEHIALENLKSNVWWLSHYPVFIGYAQTKPGIWTDYNGNLVPSNGLPILADQYGNCSSTHLCSQLENNLVIGYQTINETMYHGEHAFYDGACEGMVVLVMCTCPNISVAVPYISYEEFDSAVTGKDSHKFKFNFCRHDRKNVLAASSILNEMLESAVANMSDKESHKLSFQQNDLLFSRSYDMFGSGDADIESIRVPSLLNCYTFNHRNQEKFKVSQRLGEPYGLKVEFDLKQYEYISTMATPGIQIFIHEQFNPILPGAMGLVLSPGLSYYMTVAKEIERKLNTPNRPCYEGAMLNGIAFNNYTYNPEACLRNQLQLGVINNCSCASPKFPLPNNLDEYCNATMANCTWLFLNEQGDEIVQNSNKYCPPACTTTKYKLTTTFLKTNSQNGALRRNVSESYFQQNIVSLNLFYQSDTVFIYSDNLQYDFMTTVSQVGGSIGCFAGMSIVSIVELVVVLVKGVWWVVGKFKKSQNEN